MIFLANIFTLVSLLSLRNFLINHARFKSNGIIFCLNICIKDLVFTLLIYRLERHHRILIFGYMRVLLLLFNCNNLFHLNIIKSIFRWIRLSWIWRFIIAIISIYRRITITFSLTVLFFYLFVNTDVLLYVFFRYCIFTYYLIDRIYW
jgi:hypothetical protein